MRIQKKTEMKTQFRICEKAERDATEVQFSKCYAGNREKKQNVQFYLIHAHLYASSLWNASHCLL